MDWNQIEKKWAAMTLRVRADLCVDASNPRLPSTRRAPKIRPEVFGEQAAVGAGDSHVKMPSE